jgi:hypothetical protein
VRDDGGPVTSKACMLSGSVFFYFFLVILCGVRLSPLGTAATTGLLYQPRMIDDHDCGVICATKIGRGNRSTRRKPARATLSTTNPI